MTKAFRFSVQVGILGTGAALVVDGQLTPGMMIAGSIIMGRALAPIEQGITAWRGFVGARQAWRRVNALLQDFGDADAAEGPDLPRPEGKVEAENLSAVPPGGEVPVVREVNFALPAGTLTGLIGPSGQRQVVAGQRNDGRLAGRSGRLAPGWRRDPRLARAPCAANTSATCRKRLNCSRERWRRTYRAWRNPTPRA